MKRSIWAALLATLVALALAACGTGQAGVSRGGSDGLQFSDETDFRGPDAPRTNVADVRLAGGSARRGAQIILEVGCDACHVIPGIPTATSYAGPPLTAWAQRRFIAGSLPNDFQNLVLWLLDPQAIEPGTAMPDVGLTEQEARDVAAYLFTLEKERRFGN